MKDDKDSPGESYSREHEAAEDEPVVLPINGVLDLHTFAPGDVKELLDDYITACLENKILDLRIIHGKGKGILRDRVRALLARHPQVEVFAQAPLEAGGWGATLVRLRDPDGGASR